VSYVQQRTVVVSNRNIDVGNKIATRKPSQPDADAGSSAQRIQRQQGGNCGVMSQQRCDSGHQSAPQKLVQLVGYRDPRTQAESVKR
jgi:hypothetical protein